MDDALENANEAVALYVEGLQEDGESPEPESETGSVGGLLDLDCSLVDRAVD